MAHFIPKLTDTCWQGTVAGVSQAWSFKLSPTFYHNGAVFQLQYFNQCDRYADDVLAEYKLNGLLLRVVLNDTYYALWSGDDMIEWTSDSGKIMTWNRVGCWPSTVKVTQALGY